MNFFNLATIRRLFAPRHELSCSWLLWLRLCRKLRERGRRYSRESGAFLLGRREDGRARVVDFILYDDLDPHCLDSGIVRFDGRYFSELWAICKARGLSVVADVHVHPGGAGQSDSDRDHPMISRAGHIALILPRFATDAAGGQGGGGAIRRIGSGLPGAVGGASPTAWRPAPWADRSRPSEPRAAHGVAPSRRLQPLQSRVLNGRVIASSRVALVMSVLLVRDQLVPAPAEMSPSNRGRRRTADMQEAAKKLKFLEIRHSALFGAWRLCFMGGGDREASIWRLGTTKWEWRGETGGR